MIWYNTLWGSLAGNHDDNLALTDPEKSYGYLIEQLGARILQTDQPAYLLDYLRKKVGTIKLITSLILNKPQLYG